jgi:hypothetical protein
VSPLARTRAIVEVQEWLAITLTLKSYVGIKLTSRQARVHEKGSSDKRLVRARLALNVRECKALLTLESFSDRS